MAWDGKTNNYPFPIYFGEHFHIGDRELMEQCRLDATRTRQSCNEQCSYWKGSTASEKSAESDAVGDRPDGDDAGDPTTADDGVPPIGPLNIMAAVIPMDFRWSECPMACNVCHFASRRRRFRIGDYGDDFDSDSSDGDDDDDDDFDRENGSPKFADECVCSSSLRFTLGSASSGSLSGDPEDRPGPPPKSPAGDKRKKRGGGGPKFELERKKSKKR